MKIPRLDRATERESDSFEEVAAVGVLMESPGFEEGSTLLQAARVQAAMTMLRRSGLNLVLLPVGAAVLKRKRRRWWRRPQ